jgi:SAM-dependent methyltransferase
MAVRKEDMLKVVTGSGLTMAERADKHELYESAVQNVVEECKFVSKTFAKIRGRKPLSFREDFCGTASAACQWSRLGPKHTAIGVDIDKDVLAWGRKHRYSRLDADQKSRVTLLNANVLDADTGLVDVVGAFNFSYWIFQTRAQMLEYFRKIHATLKDDGIFFLDAFGGSEAFEEMKEKTQHENFTYVWEQARYSPVSGEIQSHIHFKFPDKSKLKRAFSYTWRLWTLPELTELLKEAGFPKVTVYWEGTDEEGEGNGIFMPDDRGEADAGWIAYIVAEK